MKRCPECGREYDTTMMFCLDDGTELLYGPASGSEPGAGGVPEGASPSGVQVATGFPSDEPQTAILHSTAAPGEAPTRAQIHTTEQTAVFPRGAEAEPRRSLGDLTEKQSFSANRAAKPLIVAAVAVAVLVGGFFGYRYFSISGSSAINSIAVLPFENRSGSGDTEYLSDGLADSLIYRLSQLPNLKVSPTSSVMRYKGSATDVAQIAKELEVDAVMSGRLTQRGDDLSISVQLIDSRTKKLIWAEQFDRKIADLLATQREIATTITQKLQLKLSGEEKGITKKYTDSNEAYQLYLKGRYHWNKRTGDGLERAAEFYNQAIEKDPGFALAYAALAETYVLFAAYGSLTPSEAMPWAKAAALKSIEIDSSLAEPHTALAGYYGAYAWNFERSEQELRKAIELNPNYPTTWHWMGNLLPIVGKNDEAIAAAKRAEELDPLSAIISADTGFDLIIVRRPDEAVEQAKRTLAIDPNFFWAYYVLAMAHNVKGRHVEAETAARRAFELNPVPISKGILVASLAGNGKRAEAQMLMEELLDESRRRYVPGYVLAVAHLGIGDKDAALAMLERDIRERGIFMQWFTVNPVLDSLRGDPRFQALLKKQEKMKLD